MAHRGLGARCIAKTGESRVIRRIQSIIGRTNRTSVLFTLIAIALVGAVLGGLIFVSGLVPINASSRHWPITEWLLKTAMKRSVSTHSLEVKAPPLADPDLVLKGAAHFEIGCRSCHGSPGFPQPRIAHMMTPAPSDLMQRAGTWKDEELFYVIKHGVKFTGMPAWPAAERDDEVWAMVAFLRRLPKLNEEEYRKLANGEPKQASAMEILESADQLPQATLQSCARCHGESGIGRGSGAFPNLAGQRRDYLKNALEAYGNGNRHSGIMQPIAAALDARTIADLSNYYSRLPAGKSTPDKERDVSAIERGKAIAQHGIPSQRLPSCVDCHSPEGGRHNPAYPDLSGQPADYLVLQLELFKTNRRGGSAYTHIMNAVASRLKPEQMRDVALYFESLGLQPASP